MIPVRTPAKWKIAKTLLDARNILPDEMGLFLQQDNADYVKVFAQIFGGGVIATKFTFSTLTMSIHDSVNPSMHNVVKWPNIL